MSDKNVYSVSAIVSKIKTLFDDSFCYVKVKGEIVNLKIQPTTGHCYATLKDKENSINLAIWKTTYQKLNFEPKDGMEVVITGRVSIYKERSTYNLVGEKVELSGEGNILKILQERKLKLEKEGLFASERKRKIRKLPQNVAIITAESGAALQDILVRLKNRTPIQKLYLHNSLVQGINATKDIIEGIRILQNYKLDVIVITRGGGSMDDLMCFNDEDLVRAVVASKIPIISAVGHEVDWTLIDYAADLRLPTPTSVAEHITLPKAQAIEQIKSIFRGYFYRKISRIKNRENILKQKIEIGRRLIFSRVNRFNKNVNKLNKINPFVLIKNIHNKRKEKLYSVNIRLLKYKMNYPIVKDKNDNLILLRREVTVGGEYKIYFADGVAVVKVLSQGLNQDF
ncbi:MAG: exodeoxyribonuclease VII large subunit [Rickettsiales bacterium]|jgi:exodeoxyribonuclease VII large subunit|nr:exodeoxyribonuclease VII large subunit [Rickettsiales bacterium]